jgi:phytoene desaturase
MMKNILEYIFSATGKKLEDYCQVTPLEPMYRLRYNGEKDLMASSDHDLMRARMEEFYPGSAKGYETYLKKEKKKYDTLIPCLAIPYSSVFDLMSWQFIRSLPYLDAHRSLYDVLNRYFKDQDVITSFTFQAKYIGMSPWRAPGTFSIISYIEHSGGIYHITGGLNKLSQGMAKAFREDKGEILLSNPVREILIENKRAVGVLLENGIVDKADYIIINADFAHAMTNIVKEEHLKKYTGEKLAKKKYSCSTFMLYLGVNKEYGDLPHHNIIFADNYQKNVTEITETLELSKDFSFYVQNASVTDRTLAPKGKSTLYVLVPVPNNFSTINWEKEKHAFRDKVIAAMETRGGFSDAGKYIEQELIITPADWENKHSVYHGATFNLAHNIGQMLILRPHNEFEEFRNCYLVGGGTHPGSGLPTIYESGRISAELIMKRDGIAK